MPIQSQPFLLLKFGSGRHFWTVPITLAAVYTDILHLCCSKFTLKVVPSLHKPTTKYMCTLLKSHTASTGVDGASLSSSSSTVISVAKTAVSCLRCLARLSSLNQTRLLRRPATDSISWEFRSRRLVFDCRTFYTSDLHFHFTTAGMLFSSPVSSQVVELIASSQFGWMIRAFRPGLTSCSSGMRNVRVFPDPVSECMIQ